MSESRIPTVKIGDVVIWRQDPTSDPAPAIVTFVNGRNLALHIFTKYNAVPLLRDGVYHIDDSQSMRPGNKEAGVWESIGQPLPQEPTKGGKK